MSDHQSHLLLLSTLLILGPSVGLQPLQATPGRLDAWIKLSFVDQAFAIGVDEPVDLTPGLLDQAVDLTAAAGIGGILAQIEAAPVLLLQPSRLSKQLPQVLPDGLLKLLATNGSIVAHMFAGHPAGHIADAAIIQVRDLPAAHGVATDAADDQSLEQVAGLPPGQSLSLPVVLQLPGDGLE